MRRSKIFLQLFFCYFAAASLTVCQQTEVFTTPPNIAGCKEGGYRNIPAILVVFQIGENILLGSG